MADNVTLNAGAGGASLATDDIGGVHYQLIKTGFGALDSFTIVTATAGLPVQQQTGATWAISAASLPLPTGASTAAKQPALGTAGTASADVITVQGIASMTALLVSGTGGTFPVTDSGGSLTVDGTVTAALSATTNAGATAKTGDYDSGVGTDTVTMFGIALPASGGAVQGGTSTDPVRIDPTGTTAQPVTDNGGSLTVDGTVSITANSAVNVAQINGVTPLMGAGNTGTGSLRVTISTDQAQLTNALKVDGSATTQPVSGTVTASNATGAAAHDAAVSGNPVLVGLEARGTAPTAVTDGDAVRAQATLLGKAVVQPYAIPASTWSYAAAAGGLVNTTGVSAKAAAGAGIRNYVTRAQIVNSHQTTGTEIVINDGAAGTTLWRGWAQAAGGGVTAIFDPPLRGTANTLIEIAEITTTGTAGVLVNLQGYVASE